MRLTLQPLRETKNMITPQYLNKGDKIAIVAPAGKIKSKIVDSAVKVIEDWGLKVVSGDNIFNDHFQYAATDKERLQDFQKALDNKEIKAILCARGGYGLIRIIDKLDFTNFQKNPKWIVGFSDITILHSHIYTNYGIETIHGTMTAGLKDSASAESLRKALFGKTLSYQINTHPLSVTGNTRGVLIGGNLAILCSLLGSESDTDTSDKILLIEDTGEYLYRLDRMMWQMKRAGKLENLAGLIVGGMTDMKDNDHPFGKTAYEIIAEAVGDYNYPVCFGFPSGHRDDNRALILGRQAVLSVGEKTTLKYSTGSTDSYHTEYTENTEHI